MSTWPQWLVIGLQIFAFGVNVARFGESKSSTVGLGDVCVYPIIGMWILWMGGFFAPLGW